MKKILTVIALLMLVGTMQAQRQVTTFLGIPVDGTKAEMKRKLVAKGFTPKDMEIPNTSRENLTGPRCIYASSQIIIRCTASW